MRRRLIKEEERRRVRRGRKERKEKRGGEQGVEIKIKKMKRERVRDTEKKEM